MVRESFRLWSSLRTTLKFDENYTLDDLGWYPTLTPFLTMPSLPRLRLHRDDSCCWIHGWELTGPLNGMHEIYDLLWTMVHIGITQYVCAADFPTRLKRWAGFYFQSHFAIFICISFSRRFHFIMSSQVTRSFVHSFIRSFVRSFIRSFIHPVSHLCTDSFMSLISCSFISILVSVLSFADALHKFNKDRRSYKPWVDCSPYFFRSFLLGMAGHHQNLVWHVSPCLDPTCVYIYLFIYVFICFFLYLFNDFYDNLYVYIQICFPHTLYTYIYIYYFV